MVGASKEKVVGSREELNDGVGVDADKAHGVGDLLGEGGG